MNNALIITDGTEFKIQLVPDADKLKTAVLAEAKKIIRVDEFTDQIAVDALKGIKDIIKKMEKSRKDAKSPALEFGRKIDDIAARFVADLETEAARVSELIATFEAEKRRIAAEAEAKRQEEVRKKLEEQRRIEAEERQKREAAEAELAKARNAKARAEAQAKLDEQKKADEERWKKEQETLRNLPAPAKAEKAVGQVTREVFTFEVTDIHALYAHDRSLVRMEPNTSAINAKIGGGLVTEIPGLIIRKEIKVGTR